jgi:FMN phosphatase YigB (HAD superfamily)
VQSAIRLVVFDLGRVLVKICDNWQHAAEVAKLPSPLPQFDEKTRASLRAEVFANERGELSQTDFCDRAGSLLGIDPQHVHTMSNIYLLGTFPRVGQLLDDLTESGRAIACLSNTNDNHWRIMFSNDEQYAELNRLQHRFASHLIALRKPDPKIYQHVEEATGFSPSEILFFDDMLDNIESARRRGWWAEQILPDENPVAQMRRHLIRFNVLPKS